MMHLFLESLVSLLGQDVVLIEAETISIAHRFNFIVLLLQVVILFKQVLVVFGQV
jgi:hypothetical protein